MSTNRSGRINNYWLFLVYTLLFVLVGLYVFVANDESLPIIEIFQWNYLIPVSIYAFGAIGLSFIIFLLLQKRIPIVLSLVISIIIGLPIGLMLIAGFFNLLSIIR